jgi:hypothetical protein
MEAPPVKERKHHADSSLASWNSDPADHSDPAVAVAERR